MKDLVIVELGQTWKIAPIDDAIHIEDQQNLLY